MKFWRLSFGAGRYSMRAHIIVTYGSELLQAGILGSGHGHLMTIIRKHIKELF